MNSLGRRRATYRIGLANLEREQAAYRDAQMAEIEELRRQAIARHKAAREEDKTRVRLTREEVEDARYVRDRVGWHEVVRVNAKSVAVKTPYSWTNRIPLEKILEARL